MQAMQNEILNHDSVQKIFAMQNGDGWFGNGLHGGGNKAIIAAILSVLGESEEHPIVKEVSLYWWLSD